MADLTASPHQTHARSGPSLTDVVEDLAVLAVCVISVVIVGAIFALLLIV